MLTNLVYHEATLRNQAASDFLNGSVSVYLDSSFVGRTELAAVARGKSFTLGLGADPQLRSTRALQNRAEEIQGGNKIVTLDYQLAIENFSDEVIKLRLLDRLPFTEDDSAIKISVLDSSQTLNNDTLYARVEKPKGILRWDIEVSATANG